MQKLHSFKPAFFVVVFQCPQSWSTFNRSWYKLFIEEKNWNDAESICNSNIAQLVSIGSADENDFIKRKFLTGNPDYWIGLTDTETEGAWKWTNGATLHGYTNWSGNQPNGYNQQNCGAIIGGTDFTGRWLDASCSANKGFICELIQWQKSPNFI